MTSSAGGRPWISNIQYNYEYTSWAEFISYRPYDTHQWKSKVLVWWSVSDVADRGQSPLLETLSSGKAADTSFLQLLFLSPEKGLLPDSWMTVRIGVKGVCVEEIEAWIQAQYGYLASGAGTASQ